MRADVGAVLTGRLPWMQALFRLEEPMPAIFDEQVRQLGPGVQTLEMPGDKSTTSDERKIRRGDNVFLCEDVVFCLGTTLDRAILNAELVEKCAQAFVLARLTGKPVRRVSWLVRWEAFRRLRRDERRAAETFACGRMPSQTTAY
jgi:ribulose-5-phosphate 4-epimerase/fuculose-1-phosphate aldolase